MDTDPSDTTSVPGFDPFLLDDGGGGAGRGGWHLSSMGWIPHDPASGGGDTDGGDDDFLKQRTFQPGSDAPWPDGGDGGAARPATLALGNVATAAPVSTPKPASGKSSPEDSGGWVYYDPSGNDDADMDKVSDAFSSPYHMQPGYGSQQGGRPGNDGNGRNGAQGGLDINSDFTRPSLPPAPNGAFATVPGGTLGSNSGNAHDYRLDNPGPLGISMDTGTVAGKFSPPAAGFGQSPAVGGGNSRPGDWDYYDPTGGGDGVPGDNNPFSRPYSFQIGNEDLRQQGKEGFNLNNNPTGAVLPPGSNGALMNVPDWKLGSNSGNDHNYNLDNPRPLGISMDTGTEKEINPSIWTNRNLLRQTSQTQFGQNNTLPWQGGDNLTKAISGTQVPTDMPSAPGQKSGRFLALMPYISKWENVYDRHGNVIAEYDPNDPGGVTKYGIDQRSHPGVDVPNLTEKQAMDIYWKEWQRSGAETHPYPLGELYFSTKSNGGGDELLAKSGGDPNRFVDAQKARYRHIVEKKPDQSRFLPGWLNRADDARNYFLIPH